MERETLVVWEVLCKNFSIQYFPLFINSVLFGMYKVKNWLSNFFYSNNSVKGPYISLHRPYNFTFNAHLVT
jgi:hypothetical protein